MKYFLYIFLYLNIYTHFSDSLRSQNLTLEITAENEISDGLKDTLQFNSSFKNYQDLKRDVDSLLPRFTRLGFIESRLEKFSKKNDSVFEAKYFLGNQWKELRVFYTEEDFDRREISSIVSEVEENYFTIPIFQTETVLRSLNELMAAKGNSFAKLKLVELTKLDSNTITAQLILTGGPVRTIDAVVVKGYDKFPKSFLRHYAGIKTGKVFNQKKVIEQNEVLNSLGFVKTIRSPEALFRRDSTSVYFYLEKRNNNLFDGILGFNTNEETQKLEFNGYLNLELNNNLNFGEQLLINYKADGREQQNFRVRTTLPFLFKSPFGVSAELKIFKQDSTFTTTDQQVRVSYQVLPSSNVYVGYKTYESSNLRDQIVAGSTVQDYDSKYLLVGGSYQKLQPSTLFPLKTFFGVDTEMGTRETMDTSEEQFRVSSTLNHIFNLNLRNSIYLNNVTSVLSSDTYLTNELFRFGGINSIRGFSENIIEASLFSVLNTEYRYLLGQTTYIHSIIDLGYFENQTLGLKEELYSFGLGLGLLTEAGLFRLNIANGVSGMQNFKFSNTKIHISLSSRF